MTTDPIADMLTRIRNGLSAAKSQVLVPHSRIKFSIAQILHAQGFIGEVSRTKLGAFDYIQISLENTPKPITNISRVSKPGRRLYASKLEIPKVLNGRGIVILSTPAGIMTGFDARRKGVGGELICKVW